MRPSGALVADYQGTVDHVGRGYCSRCYKKQRSFQSIEVSRYAGDCVKCGRLMRKSYVTVAEAPDTVRCVSVKRGVCATCEYRAKNNLPRSAKEAKAAEAEERARYEKLSSEILGRMDKMEPSVASFLRDRRSRTIPTTGVPRVRNVITGR